MEPESSRKSDIYIKRDFIENDTVIYYLPDNYAIDILPKDIIFNSEFGDYKSSFKIDSDMLIFSRVLNIKSGFYPVYKYNDYFDFFMKIYANDERSLVIRKKTNNN